jgi:hypothetical protein
MRNAFWLALPLSVLVGCSAAVVDLPLGDEMDSDGDGLSDAEEIDLLLDPDDADYDDDGWDDGEEVGQGTDPADAADHPYTGGWPIDGVCRDSVSGTGNNVGDVAQDWTLPDQFGDNVRLHDFCAKTILLVSGTFT